MVMLLKLEKSENKITLEHCITVYDWCHRHIENSAGTCTGCACPRQLSVTNHQIYIWPSAL